MKILDRQAQILEVLAHASHDGKSLRDLAREVDLPPSTVHRILQALLGIGFVSQNQQSSQYRLGSGFLRLTGAYLEHAGVDDLLGSYVELLSSRTQLVSFASIREGHNVVCICVKAPRQTTNFYVRPGQLMPLHASAAAKALIFLDPAPQLEMMLRDPVTQVYTPKTLTSVQAVLADLEKGRGRGYWVCDEELEPDVYAVAAPILGSQGRPIASLTVLCPLKFALKDLDKLGREVVDVASTGSKEVGRVLASQAIEEIL